MRAVARRGSSVFATCIAIGASVGTVGVLDPEAAAGQALIEVERVLHTWDGQPVDRRSIRSFRSVPEAEEVVECIAAESGTSPDTFVVRAGAVPNAAAAMLPRGCGNAGEPCERALIYNPKFIADEASAEDGSGTKWGAVTVMAHEISHHLQGHTSKPGGSNVEDELQADEQAGWLLRRLGASQEQALALFRNVAAEEETETHPGREDRLTAVTNGWLRAQEESPTSCYARRTRGTSRGGPQSGREEPSSEPPKVDFGDDSGRFSRDGECDDARFEGDGRSLYPGRDHIRRDAFDCREMFEQGRVHLRSDYPNEAEPPRSAEVDFGDDSGRFSRDGECDDLRFDGVGRSVYEGSDHIRRDASDCRELYERGRVEVSERSAGQGRGRVEFGDDSGLFAQDGECDDARFEGRGHSGYRSRDHVLRDASDCREAFVRDLVRLSVGSTATEEIDEIDFGGDSGRYARDGECDDARFTGVARNLGILSHVMRDASDCRLALEQGRIEYLGDLQ